MYIEREKERERYIHILPMGPTLGSPKRATQEVEGEFWTFGWRGTLRKGTTLFSCYKLTNLNESNRLQATS